jgi:mono/diheme cytochrome c family protein
MPKKCYKKGFPVAWVAAVMAVPLCVAMLLLIRSARPKSAYASTSEAAEIAAPPANPSLANGFVAHLAPSPAGESDYRKKVWPLLSKYCIGCHNDDKVAGGVTFEDYKDEAAALKDRKIWETVDEVVRKKVMPPKDKPAPSDFERKNITEWIETTLSVDCGRPSDPGRPTIHRLNRAEYNNTIRDLTGVKFQPADDFPSDDVGYGFDNIGDVLSMPPILLEKYLAAAEKVLDQALAVEKPPIPSKTYFRPQKFRSNLPAPGGLSKNFPMLANGRLSVTFNFPIEGEYLIRWRAFGQQVANEHPKMTVELDKKALKSFDVDAVEGRPKFYEARTKIAAGRHDVELAFGNYFEDKTAKDPKKKARSLSVESLEIEGPFNTAPKEPSESYKRIIIAKPAGNADKEIAAKKIIENFASKAYRRPARAEEVSRLLKLFKIADGQGDSFEKSVSLALRAVLVSPNFLFRIEKDAEPKNPKSVHPVSDYELASRLSYFLWSTMPDAELFALAERGELHKPGVLEAQVKRMLADSRSRALTDNFASQWLNLRMVAGLAPDAKTYPKFDSALKNDVVRETELFFDHVVKNDRSVLEFLDSDWTFLNARLAKHYGIDNVTGSEFRKVTLTDRNRGGVLTQASVLTLTSNPTRTSPVKRGKWILENILGTPPPPPPPDVPELKEEKQGTATGSLRKRMEQHRSNPACATCHQKMDPLGFGLENFDGVGAWRAFDGKFKIDPAGTLPGGEVFNGPAELRKVLLGKSDQFRRNLSEKLLTYALGRGLEYYDRCAVIEIVKKLKSGSDRFSALVVAIVQSEPFQKRRSGGKE